MLWLVFATIYYGFPLPNTYYAKVANGIPRSLMIARGSRIVLNSVSHDPITLGTDRLRAVVCRRAGRRRARRAAYPRAVRGLHRLGRRRFHERPVLRMPFLVASWS